MLPQRSDLSDLAKQPVQRRACRMDNLGVSLIHYVLVIPDIINAQYGDQRSVVADRLFFVSIGSLCIIW